MLHPAGAIPFRSSRSRYPGRVPHQSILTCPAVFAMIRAFLQYGGRLLLDHLPSRDYVKCAWQPSRAEGRP
jgi:hypothetical protein